MGNVKSTQPPKLSKDRKAKGNRGSAGTGKDRNGKAIADQNPRDFNRRNVGPCATNPFIIFFLQLRSKKPKEPVTMIARAAGKLWTRMTPQERKKYIDLANAEKKRREEKRRKRKRSALRSRMK